MIKWIARAYRKMPCERKRWILKFFSPVKWVLASINELFFQVYEISGENAVFITSIEPDIGFLENFYPQVTLKKTQSIFAWSLKSFSRRYDKVIIEMDRKLLPFFNDGLITFPFIRQVYNFEKAAENLKQFRERKKYIQMYDLEVSKDPELLTFFYEKMYVPYAKSRHQETALIDDFSKLEYYLKKNGELLLLKRKQEIIGGSFCRAGDDTYYGSNIALMDDRYLKEEAIGALYYFTIVRARELKARFVDFGESRPFLFNGVLGYKRRWGGRIIINKRNNHCIYLKNVTKNGLIFLENDKLTAEIFPEGANMHMPQTDSDVEIRTINPAQ